MSNLIPDAVVEWLLEPDNPPVRYLTLTELLGHAASAPDVEEARDRLNDYGPTQAILSQVEQFQDDDAAKSYWKYTGKYWQLIFLGQYRADGRDPRIQGIAERLIESRDWVLIPQGGQCLTANLLSALTLLGYGEHPVVRDATVGLADRLRADGGIDCEVMEYSLLPLCYMAQPKLLLCFAGQAGLRRHPSVSAAIEMLCANLVAHEIFVYVPGNRKEWMTVLEGKPPKDELGGATVKSWMRRQKEKFLAEKGIGKPTEKPGWLKFGFPLHYNSDLLEALYALALGGAAPSESLGRPLDILRGKMTKDGRWLLENTLNGKMRVDVETKGKPSKWLTYRAWYVLRHFAAGLGTEA
jgi:hypothetical protein